MFLGATTPSCVFCVRCSVHLPPPSLARFASSEVGKCGRFLPTTFALCFARPFWLYSCCGDPLYHNPIHATTAHLCGTLPCAPWAPGTPLAPPWASVVVLQLSVTSIPHPATMLTFGLARDRAVRHRAIGTSPWPAHARLLPHRPPMSTYRRHTRAPSCLLEPAPPPSPLSIKLKSRWLATTRGSRPHRRPGSQPRPATMPAASCHRYQPYASLLPGDPAYYSRNIGPCPPVTALGPASTLW